MQRNLMNGLLVQTHNFMVNHRIFSRRMLKKTPVLVSEVCRSKPKTKINQSYEMAQRGLQGTLQQYQISMHT